MTDTAWQALIKIHANGRPVCNCGDAYYSPCGVGIDGAGNKRDDMIACDGGCSFNKITAKDYIAKRVLMGWPLDDQKEYCLRMMKHD